MRAALGLIVLVVIHAASIFVVAFHPRGAFRQSSTPTTRLALKKIADEESSVSAGSKVSEASAKTAKKKGGGKRSSSSKEGSEDWRSKKGLPKADTAVAVNQEQAETAAEEQAAREAEAAALEAASAAAEAAVAEEAVPATSVVAAIATSTAAIDSEEDAQETLKFIETMSAGAQQMSVDGLFDTPLGEKKKTKRQRQEEAGVIQQQQEAKSNPLDALLRVPRENPLAGGILPPEVVFFGEPRRPPPVYVSTNLDFRSNLLYWARHGNVVPRDSAERLARVFPRGVLEKDSKVTRHRLPPAQLSSYEGVYKAWLAVMDDLEEAKAFISANVDTVPPTLFLRAMTAKKLAAQSKGDVAEMTRLKDVRQKYMVAKDQLFFPLNVERIKAETRVMTYLARDEVRNFAKSWDEVEMSLYMTSLVAARMKWDFACGEIMSNIKAALELTVEYMRENTYETLMQKEYRKPSITADTYRNASLNLQFNMPALYEKISPEVKMVHETYFLMEAGESDEALRHMKAFCAKEGIAEGLLRDRLKVFESSIACLQGHEYTKLRLRAAELFGLLSTKAELNNVHKWFHDMRQQGGDKPSFGFESYQPDDISAMVRDDQRQRRTGNAFSDFWMQVMKMPTLYTPAFSGSRPKGSSVGNWLELDPTWADKEPLPVSDEERLAQFRQAYATQMQLRKEAEAKRSGYTVSRMDEQDRILGGDQPLVIEFKGEEE